MTVRGGELDPARPDAPPLPWPALGVAVAMLLAASIAGRDLWFFSDDWNIYADYHSGNLLTPFNGHLSLAPAGIYQLLFHTVGTGSYLPYRLAGLSALAVLAFQLVRCSHDRLGAARRPGLPVGTLVVALVAAAVLWNSAGTMNLLFPFLMNFSLPIAALLAIWWHLDRADEPGAAPLRHELAASAWLCLALGTSGLGLMTMAAVGVELLVSRAPWRRWAALAPGPILWGLWYVGHRDANEISTDLPRVLAYAARMFLGATTSVAAGIGWLGVLLAALTVGFLLLAGVRWRSLDARTLGALAAPATFILFTAVTRLDIVPAIPPDELRYSWAVAAYLLLALVMAARRTAWFDVAVPRGVWVAATVVACGVLATGAVRLWHDMEAWNTQVATARPGLSSVLFATEAIGAGRIDPDLVIPLSYVPVTTGGYLGAVADVGSPIADATADDLGGARYNRQVADQLLVEQLDIRVRTDVDDGCASPMPVAADAGGEVALQPGERLVLRRDPTEREVPVRLRRFAEPADALPLGGTSDGTLVLPLDEPAVADLPGLAERWPYRVLLPPGVAASTCG